MAVKPGERPADRPALRRVAGKSVRVQILLQPDVAAKLRLAAVGLGLDLGDLVTAGLTPLLREIQATVRHCPPAASSPPAASAAGGTGPDLRAVG